MNWTLFGLNVITSNLVKPVPVLQLRPDFTACTDKFKDEMNRWLLEMFGTKKVAYMIDSRSLVLDNATLDELNRSLHKNSVMYRADILEQEVGAQRPHKCFKCKYPNAGLCGQCFD